MTAPKAAYPPHVLVLSGECDGCGPVPHSEPCVNGQHQYDYDLHCPGITERCRGWEECLTCSGADDAALDALDETSEAHGVEHQHINGMWMTATSRCFIAGHDDQGDAVHDLGPLPPGRYEVDGEDDGDGYLVLTLVHQSAPSRGAS